MTAKIVTFEHRKRAMVELVFAWTEGKAEHRLPWPTSAESAKAHVDFLAAQIAIAEIAGAHTVELARK